MFQIEDFMINIDFIQFEIMQHLSRVFGCVGQEEICKIYWGKIIDTLESKRKGLIRNTIRNQMGNMIKFRFTIL